jgi:hypothetical protein
MHGKQAGNQDQDTSKHKQSRTPAQCHSARKTHRITRPNIHITHIGIHIAAQEFQTTDQQKHSRTTKSSAKTSGNNPNSGREI